MTFLTGSLIGALILGLLSAYYRAPPHPLILVAIAALACVSLTVPWALR